MGKKTDTSVIHTREKRKQRISNCTQCGGVPPIKEVNLQCLHTQYCDICMEVVNFTKTVLAPLPKVKKEVVEEVIEEIQPSVFVDNKTQTKLNFNDITLN